MSKAKVWATKYGKWEEAQPQRPDSCILHLAPGRTWTISIDDLGSPYISAPLTTSEYINPDDLCRWARSILDTFEENP